MRLVMQKCRQNSDEKWNIQQAEKWRAKRRAKRKGGGGRVGEHGGVAKGKHNQHNKQSDDNRVA